MLIVWQNSTLMTNTIDAQPDITFLWSLLTHKEQLHVLFETALACWTREGLELPQRRGVVPSPRQISRVVCRQVQRAAVERVRKRGTRVVGIVSRWAAVWRTGELDAWHGLLTAQLDFWKFLGTYVQINIVTEQNFRQCEKRFYVGVRDECFWNISFNSHSLDSK